MEYLVRSTPTRIPSSMSVGETLSPSPTTNLAICLTFITYLASSCPGLMILVQRATCRREGGTDGGREGGREGGRRGGSEGGREGRVRAARATGTCSSLVLSKAINVSFLTQGVNEGV